MKLNWRNLTILLWLLLFLISCNSTFAKQSLTPNPELKNWMILIVKADRNRQQYVLHKFYPFKQKVVKTYLNFKPGYFSCTAVNAVLKSILCGGMLINYETGKVMQRVFVSGPISPDGRYIIDSTGYGIYDIKAKRIISYYPKEKNDVLAVKGGVTYSKTLMRQGKKVPYHQLADADYLTIRYPTTPKPDGRFLAFRQSDPGGNIYPKYIYEYNLYEIIKKKGFGFSAKKRPEFGIEPGSGWTQNYVGKKHYLWGAKQQDGSISPHAINRKQINPTNDSFIAFASNDGKWALTYPTNNKGNIGLNLYDVKNKKIEIKNLKEQFNIPNNTSPVFWVWIGDPKKHPGFVDY